ncbi:EboA domain-containing protein [Streptomyces monticola]|uniref:EboA domain-containing protein n=1 Tax=Streptomyces monticola TaxID=2666263 RepID=A0ABW2JBK6_9ACTN
MTDGIAPLRARLDSALDGATRAWLDQALAEASAHAAGSPDEDPAAAAAAVAVWELRFAEAGRRCGAELADDARVLLLHTADAGLPDLTRLYQQGTAAERRAVLLSLPHLVVGPQALPLTEDALRTNDTRLVAAAVGPYAAEHLDAHQWRHAVLKCLFTGVPVDAVAALPQRARGDGELARMLGDYAGERTAAGRPVPGDLHRVLALTTPTAEPADPAPPTERAEPTEPAVSPVSEEDVSRKEF